VRAHLDGLSAQLEGHAVQAVVELDVVIDVGARPLALAAARSGAAEALSCARSSDSNASRRVPGSFWKRRVLSSSSRSANGVVELGEREENRWPARARIQRCAMSTPLDLGLAFGLAGGAGMIAMPSCVELGEGVVCVGSYRSGRFTALRSWSGTMMDVRLEVSRARTVLGAEVRHGLRESRFRERVVARAEHADEQLDLDDFASVRIANPWSCPSSRGTASRRAGALAACSAGADSRQPA